LSSVTVTTQFPKGKLVFLLIYLSEIGLLLLQMTMVAKQEIL
jgi:hypothetical protein